MTKLEVLRQNLDTTPAVESAQALRVALVSSSSGSRGGGELYLVGLAQGLECSVTTCSLFCRTTRGWTISPACSNRTVLFTAFLSAIRILTTIA